MHLLETQLGMGQVADAETHHGGVEALIGAGQALRVPLEKGDAGGQVGLSQLGPACGHHGPVDIVDQHPAGGADGLGGQESQVGGAAADVKDPVPPF